MDSKTSIRSNSFRNHENLFIGASKEQITDTALRSAAMFINAELKSLNNEAVFAGLVLGALLGVSGDGVVSDIEKELIHTVFKKICTAPIEDIYEMVDRPISEDDYSIVELITKLGNDVAIPYLDYILSFAYIDGKFEDDVAERLDGIFGLNFLVEFFKGGEESMTVSVQITDLENKLVDYYKKTDSFLTVDQVCKAFPTYNKESLQEALDSLCDKQVFYKFDTICGVMYAYDD